jgi:hypothetical protein
LGGVGAIAIACGTSEFGKIGDDAGAGSDATAAPDDGLPDAPSSSDVLVIPDAPPFLPGCEKSPSVDPTTIRDECGVFVKKGATGGNGSKAAPFATIAEAIPVAKNLAKNRVYVCAEEHTTALVLDSGAQGVSFFGGMECSAWAYTGARATIRVAAPGPALRATGLLVPALVEDIDFRTDDASAPGGNAVAVVIEGSQNLTFRRSKMTAGNGAAAGAAGAEDNYPSGSPTAGAGGPLLGCLNTCLGGEVARGGNGGTTRAGPVANSWIGLNGEAGAPLGVANGGMGSFIDSMTDDRCGDGDAGENGGVRSGGAGATTRGYFDAATWVAAPGAPGGFGRVGQGGGGGGGQAINGTPNGVIGGGGGCGGCGGARGRGGLPGGSSFALVSLGSQVVLDACELVSGNGGNGGPGGSGGAGQGGGSGYVPDGGAFGGCRGGPGGAGGPGAGGGGGAGGSSIALAYTGTIPATTNGTQLNPSTTVGQAGAPGAGGSPAATAGVAGESAQQKQY